MKVIMFGNRGSRPLGASQSSPFGKYGGDTTSMGIICGKHIIALDMGSGFSKWEEALETEGFKAPYTLSVLQSHLHLDHTCGITHSPLLFQKGNQFDFYAPDGLASGQNMLLRQVFEILANEPFNPNLMDKYAATLNFHDLPVDRRSEFELEGGVKITTLPADHAGIKVLGYRIDYDGRSAAIISDRHHKISSSNKPVIDGRVIDFIRGCDVFISDAHYSDSEFIGEPYKRSWGHSTGEHGVRECYHAGVPLFIAHHHDPAKTDEQIDWQIMNLKSYARAWGVDVIPATPDMRLDIGQKSNIVDMRPDSLKL